MQTDPEPSRAATRACGRPPGRRADLAFVTSVSVAVLGYELLLTRVLDVHYWPYFGAMVISLAMLGFAASGTALFLAARRAGGTAAWVPRFALALAVAIPVCPRLTERLECVPLVVLWDARQLLVFLLNYLILSLPLFLGGFIIGHFFLSADQRPGRVYAANLAGSAAGVAGAFALLWWLPPALALCIVPAPILVALWPRTSTGTQRGLLYGAGAALLLVAATTPRQPMVSSYKSLPETLLLPDARVTHASWSPFGHAVVVASDYLRYAPGLSLAYAGDIPSQQAIFTDGDSMETVYEAGATTQPEFFNSRLMALAYRFHAQPSVLVVGAGGGLDVLDAVNHGALRIDALESNPDIVRLMSGPLAEFTGGLYARPEVRLHRVAARAFGAATTNRYDLVVIPGKGSLFASTAGTSAQAPDYLLTREACADFLALLAPGGLVAVETWLNLPPRQEAKLLATFAAELHRRGVDPKRHLLLARSLRTCLLLAFRDPISDAQVAAARTFCDAHSFDRDLHPGLRANELNRFNQTDGAPHHALALQLLNHPSQALRANLLQLRPATDDRPYFAHFFRWAALPQLVAKTRQNVAVHVGWGYMFLVVTLLQAVPLGALLILVPLARLGRTRSAGRTGRRRAYAYFAAIGLAFMLVEMTVIQQVVRFLPHPALAFGLTVVVMLSASGLGAWASGYRWFTPRRVFTALIVLVLMHALLWQMAIRLRSMTAFRIDMATVALLAFWMGMPFPLAIARLRAHDPAAVPWAWGINGYASVLAVLSAGLCALAWGLTATTAAGALCYAAAAALFPGRHDG